MSHTNAIFSTGMLGNVFKATSKFLLVLFLSMPIGIVIADDDDDDEDPQAFTDANFKGTYGGVFSGFFPSPLTGQSVFTVASAIFIADGKGGLIGTLYLNPPGTSVSGGAPTGIDPGGGIAFVAPAVVRPDGTGFAEVTLPLFLSGGSVVFNIAFVLADIRDGVAHKVLFNQNSSGFTASGFLVRQTNRETDD